MKDQLIILGAGKPLHGEEHTVLRGANGDSSVLDWLLKAFQMENESVHFIGGYRMDKITERYPSLNYIYNTHWESTNAGGSLLISPLSFSGETYITYSDVLFHDSTVENLKQVKEDIVVAVDSTWKHRFSGRTKEDIQRCEKVFLHGDSITRLGNELDSDLADAEFIGLCKFSPVVSDYLSKNKKNLSQYLNHLKLSHVVEFIRSKGFKVKFIDVEGDWAELNEPMDLTRFILGTKAQTLYRLRKLVTSGKIEDQVMITVKDWKNKEKEFIDSIQSNLNADYLVVRSSALSEDSFTSANAGAYTSILNVPSKDRNRIKESVEEVIQSYPDNNPDNQVLVQPMIQNVKASGVAFTRSLAHGSPYYIINYDDTSSSTESITGGTSKDHKTLVIHKHYNYIEDSVPKNISGLVPAITEIESILGYDSLDIEFAIDANKQVYILQVRPIAVVHDNTEKDDKSLNDILQQAKSRFHSLQIPHPFIQGDRAIFGIMPDWNPAEIIGTKPKRLATSIYRYLILDEAWSTQRMEYGYKDVRPAPLLVNFAGHPYIDVRASFNSFTPASLDDESTRTLINFYLETLIKNPEFHDKVEFDVVPTCYSLEFEKWEKKFLQNGISENTVEKLKDSLKKITFDAFTRCSGDLESISLLENRFNRIAGSNMVSLDKALVLLEDCKRYGTVAFSHLARSAFVSITILKSAVSKSIISPEGLEDFLNSIRTVSHEFTYDAHKANKKEMSEQEFIDKYGHLRPGTYDITSLSYRDNPEHFVKPIIQKSTHSHSYETKGLWNNEKENLFNRLKEDGFPHNSEIMEKFFRNAIEGREYAKFIFTKNLSKALDLFVEFGKTNNLTREELAHIPLETFQHLRSGNTSFENLEDYLLKVSKFGMESFSKIQKIELPPLIVSESDFHIFLYPNTQANFIGSGRVTADVVDLTNFDQNNLPDLSGKIAMIPQADPGYDWLFGQEILGLITMYGGANSHMAIRSAEFGLPAAIGIGETKYASLSKASVLELDAGNRKIQVIQ